MTKFWQNFKLLANPTTNLPELSDIAGNDGENEFGANLSKIDGLAVFKNKRIKDGNAGLHEIDFIIVHYKKIYLVEIKNWSGSVSQNAKKEWIQTNKNKTINHANPLLKLLRNTTFFVNFLRKAGFDLSGYEIFPQVVFMSKSLKFAKNFKDEYYIKKSGEFLQQISTKKRYFKFKKPRKNDPKLIELLSSLTVWSRLYLYGGAVLTGSIRYFEINGKKTRLPKHFRANLSLKWSRNKPISFLNSLFGKRKKIQIKSKIFKIKPTDSVGFLQAGNRGIKLVKFGLIEKIIKDDIE